VKIKKVDTSHAEVRDAILAMHAGCFPGLEFQQLHGDWWIAYAPGGVPVGFAGMWPSLTVPGAGYLCRAGVLPAARGQGLQTRLIRVREREAKKKRYVALLTDCDPVNTHSMNNIIGAGFRAFRPSEPWTVHPVWCYWRKIIDEGVA
jgi:GNAT superfamily N-acetyltransferase